MSGGARPELDYPCRWSYTVIGSDRERVKAAVAAVVGDRPHALTPSKTSAKGTYVSMRLELKVHSEDDRRGLFEELKARDETRFVL